jgi:hypothetical protein
MSDVRIKPHRWCCLCEDRVPCGRTLLNVHHLSIRHKDGVHRKIELPICFAPDEAKIRATQTKETPQ